MKYLKLFEQFDEEEAWWDEPDPYEEKLMIFNYMHGNYYLGTLDGNIIKIYKDYPTRTWTLGGGWRVHSKDVLKPNDKIQIYIPNVHNCWNIVEYKDLPTEIKDRLI